MTLNMTCCVSKGPSECSASLTVISSLPKGFHSAIQRGRNQDGREQPGHGDGPQLPSMPIWRSTSHLREHPQGDVLPANAHRSLGHKLHRRGGVDTVNHLCCWSGPLETSLVHLHSCKKTLSCSDHTGISWLVITHLTMQRVPKQHGLCSHFLTGLNMCAPALNFHMMQSSESVVKCL